MKEWVEKKWFSHCNGKLSAQQDLAEQQGLLTARKEELASAKKKLNDVEEENTSLAIAKRKIEALDRRRQSIQQKLQNLEQEQAKLLGTIAANSGNSRIRSE
jgi:chromosome segregation ATPase